MHVRAFVVATGMVAVAALPFAARERAADDGINAKIRQEGMSHSQIMRTLHYLSDIYGPRLTGSPNHKAAAEWAIKQMTEWGMTNGHLEPWDFGHEGWLNEYLAVHVTAPYKDALVVEALGWTPGTPGRGHGQGLQSRGARGTRGGAEPQRSTGCARRTRPGASRPDTGGIDGVSRQRQGEGRRRRSSRRAGRHSCRSTFSRPPGG